jgi:ankyrin repeat protein
MALLDGAEWNRIQLVERLLERSKVGDNRINMREADGLTSLMAAARKGHEEIVQLLLQRDDIDIHAEGALGETALSCAIENGSQPIKRLLEAKTIYFRKNSGLTPALTSSPGSPMHTETKSDSSADIHATAELSLRPKKRLLSEM